MVVRDVICHPIIKKRSGAEPSAVCPCACAKGRLELSFVQYDGATNRASILALARGCVAMCLKREERIDSHSLIGSFLFPLFFLV